MTNENQGPRWHHHLAIISADTRHCVICYDQWKSWDHADTTIWQLCQLICFIALPNENEVAVTTTFWQPYQLECVIVICHDQWESRDLVSGSSPSQFAVTNKRAGTLVTSSSRTLTNEKGGSKVTSSSGTLTNEKGGTKWRRLLSIMSAAIIAIPMVTMNYWIWLWPKGKDFREFSFFLYDC